MANPQAATAVPCQVRESGIGRASDIKVLVLNATDDQETQSCIEVCSGIFKVDEAVILPGGLIRLKDDKNKHPHLPDYKCIFFVPEKLGVYEYS